MSKTSLAIAMETFCSGTEKDLTEGNKGNEAKEFLRFLC
jgi:hypothetical protein